MLTHVLTYLDQPQVFAKIAQMYPDAARGMPANTPKNISLVEAVQDLAARSYYQRKEASLILSGLASLKEVVNE